MQKWVWTSADDEEAHQRSQTFASIYRLLFACFSICPIFWHYAHGDVAALHQLCLENIFFFPSFLSWVTWKLKRPRWDCIDGLSSVSRSRNSISTTLVQYCPHHQLELSMICLLSRSPLKLLIISSCQMGGNTWWALGLTFFPFWIWALPQVSIASVRLEGVSSSWIVQATTDDMGLIKISSSV